MAYNKKPYVRHDIRHPILRKFLVLPYILVPAFMGFVTANVVMQNAFVCTVIGCILGGFIFYIMSQRDHTASFREANLDFSRSGYTADYLLPNCLLIDSTKRVIAFVDTRRMTYETYDFHDIVSWEHQWEDQTTSGQNVFDGRAVNVKTVSAKNVLVFKIDNPQHPIQRLNLPRHEEAVIWMARLSALLK